MAKLSDSKAAKLKLTFDALTTTNNANFDKLQAAITLGWKLFNDKRLDLIELQLKQQKSDDLSFSGFLFDVAIAFVLGPLAGAVVAEATEFLIRPAVRSRVAVLHPISHASGGPKPKRGKERLLEVDKTSEGPAVEKALEKPVKPTVAIAPTVPELRDWEMAYMGITSTKVAAPSKQKPKPNPLPNDFFDITMQPIESADTAAFKAFTDDWVFDAVSDVASDEARERLPGSTKSGGTQGQIAAVAMPKGVDAGALFTTQCELYLNEQRYRNLACAQLLNWLLDVGIVAETLGTLLQAAFDKMLEQAKNTATSFTLSMVARQARVIEAILWVLWLKEQSGKKMTFDKYGTPQNSVVESIAVQHAMGYDWKVDRAYVDYWITSLINPWDDQGRTFMEESEAAADQIRQKYAGQEAEYFRKYPTGTLKKDELSRRGAETSLRQYFFRIEWDLETQNLSGDKLLTIGG